MYSVALNPLKKLNVRKLFITLPTSLRYMSRSHMESKLERYAVVHEIKTINQDADTLDTSGGQLKGYSKCK